ncbi:MAG: hypothetical protein MJE77_13130 [Proteobacteria bacterium]|nr:hypothetical protein [Pseudomonadota bacterium]
MTFTRRLGLFLTALTIVFSVDTSRGYGEPLGVALSIDPCITTDAEKVRRLLLIELGTSMPQNPPQPGTAVTTVELTCAGTLIEIRVHDPVTGKSLIRRISPGNREGRERLLALAAMELVVASWIELEATPQSVAPAADTVVDIKARKSARQLLRRRLPSRSRPPSPSWDSVAILLGDAVWTGDLHAGVGVRVIRDSSGVIGWAADVIAQSSSETVTLGRVTTNSIAGSATVHVLHRMGKLRLRGGVGARIGAVSMTGKPNSPMMATGGQITGFTSSPVLRLDAQYRAIHGFVIALAAEFGVHLLATRGLVDGTKQSVLAGPWLGGQIGIGWTW